jgi:hypothetical protein
MLTKMSDAGWALGVRGLEIAARRQTAPTTLAYHCNRANASVSLFR